MAVASKISAMTDRLGNIPQERRTVVDSTSLWARRAVETCGPASAPRLYIADQQTGGVGRFGRSWASPVGGISCTLAWPIVKDPAGVLDGLGLRLALACLHTIDNELTANSCVCRAQYKWPNDVLIDGKKTLGLLAEVVTTRDRTIVLVGVGINSDFSADDLPTAVRDRATTLLDVIGAPPNSGRMLESLVSHLRSALLERGLPRATLNELRDRLFGVDQPATVTLADGAQKTGTLVRLDDRGCPVLQIDGREWTAPMGAELSHNE